MGALTQISLKGTEFMSSRRQSRLTQLWMSVQKEGLSGIVKESLLGSVVFYPLQHLLYHQRCFFPHFAICSHIITKGGVNFFYLRIPWELSLENCLHLIPDDLLFLLDVKNNTRDLIIPQLIV
jgi:hypothetical protein